MFHRQFSVVFVRRWSAMTRHRYFVKMLLKPCSASHSSHDGGRDTLKGYCDWYID